MPGADGQHPGGEQAPPRPFEEKFQEFHEFSEEQRAEMEAKALEQMKKGLKKGAKQFLKVKKQFDAFAKKGVVIPAECTDALTTAQTAMDAAQAATTFEELEASGLDDLQTSFETINECFPKLQMLSQGGKELKRAQTMIKKLTTLCKTKSRNAPESAAEDVAACTAAVSAIQDAVTKAGEALKIGNVEDFEAALEEAYAGVDQVNAIAQAIDIAKNAKRVFAQFKLSINDAQKRITKLKKIGVDTTEAELVLTQIKEEFALAKTLKGQEFIDAMESLGDLFQELAEKTGYEVDIGAVLEKGVTAPAPGLAVPELQIGQ